MAETQLDPYAQLPVELTEHIFSFLDYRSLAAALLVSCQWNSVARNPSLWTNHFLSATWNPEDVSCSSITLSQDCLTIHKSKTNCGSTAPKGYLVTATLPVPHNMRSYWEVTLHCTAGLGCRTAIGLISEAPLVNGPVLPDPTMAYASMQFYLTSRVYPLLNNEKGWGQHLVTGDILHLEKPASTRGTSYANGDRVGVMYDNTTGEGILSFYKNGELNASCKGVFGQKLFPCVQMCHSPLTLEANFKAAPPKASTTTTATTASNTTNEEAK
ncbi:hypothetical protein QOT17_024358 [Balamuthia mandrillaris]